MKHKVVLLCSAVALLLVGLLMGSLLTGFTLAQPDGPAGGPPLINYQGVLLDPGTGDPVADGDYDFTFSIYDTDSAGDPLWQETQTVTVENGLFNVLLGSVNAFSPGVFGGIPRYLGIQVGVDAEMAPRQLLASVPYAFLAKNADTLDGMDSTDFVAVSGDTMTGTLNLPADGLVAGTDQLVLTDGKVGIGTTSWFDYKLYVQGDSHGVYGSGTDYGVYGYNSGSGNYGLLGTSSEGVYGKNISSGNYGRIGTLSAGVDASGNIYGVDAKGNTYGVYAFGTNYGVYGYSNANIGVYGKNISSGNYGRLGSSNEGVYGKHNTSSNYGRIGTSDTGVYGTGNPNGVVGYSTSGTGVLGSSSSGTGVLGGGDTGVRGIGTTYNFYAEGPGADYATFTGAHEVKFARGFPQDFRPGLIVSVTGENQVRTDEGEISYSSTLSTVRLADTTNDKTVLGVLISESPLPEEHWYQAAEGERFGIVNALGDGRVWVTNINGDIAAGDYITTSAIAGYGQKQDDDLLHSYTLGKAIETIDWSAVTETVEFNGQTYKVYAIAVVYTSG